MLSDFKDMGLRIGCGWGLDDAGSTQVSPSYMFLFLEDVGLGGLDDVG
jgi:hypothetical protein